MARKQSRKKATPNKGAADQRTAIADSAERGSGKAGYTEIIHTAGLHGVDVTVGEGDLLLADAAKVLPTNEFFNLTDSNWESSAPRSIIGQYLRRLADKDREVLQKQIDRSLGRKAGSKPILGYAFGHTVVVTWKSDSLLLTNTVKYDLEEIKRRLKRAKTEKQRADRELQRMSEAIEWEFFAEREPCFSPVARRSPATLGRAIDAQAKSNHYSKSLAETQILCRYRSTAIQ